MPDTVIDYTNANQSAPWFAQAPSAQGDGLSTTNQDSSRNQQISGIANDLSGQNDDVVAALGTITTALNAKPAA